MWNAASPSKPDQTNTASATRPIPSPGVEERRIVAWVGQSVVFKGELLSSEDMRIEGRVEGMIEVRDHDLILGAHAIIRADITAKTVTIRGNVVGTVTAAEKIDITETAVIDGHLTAPRLAIAEGATIQGRVETGLRRMEAPAKASPPGLAIAK